MDQIVGELFRLNKNLNDKHNANQLMYKNFHAQWEKNNPDKIGKYPDWVDKSYAGTTYINEEWCLQYDNDLTEHRENLATSQELKQATTELRTYLGQLSIRDLIRLFGMPANITGFHQDDRELCWAITAKTRTQESIDELFEAGLLTEDLCQMYNDYISQESPLHGYIMSLEDRLEEQQKKLDEQRG